jgi:hypothetical protein
MRPVSFGVMDMLTCNPRTKDDWRQVLEYLYQMYRLAKLPVTVCPPGYAKGALRLDGVIGGRSIGVLA